jgi:hypothetical protein
MTPTQILCYLVVSRAMMAAVYDHYRVSWSPSLWALAPVVGEFLLVYVLTIEWLEKDSRG